MLDELGYLSYDARAADLLFQVVSRRYERNSLVLTTNLAFSDWPTIFPNAGSAIALIDRLIHHAEIITIEGESYRRRAAEATRKAPAPSRPRDHRRRSKFPRFSEFGNSHRPVEDATVGAGKKTPAAATPGLSSKTKAASRSSPWSDAPGRPGAKRRS